MFSGAFAKLQKVVISIVMSVCLSLRPSVCPHGTTRLPLDGFSWNLIFEYVFWSPWRKFRFYWNRTRRTRILHEDQDTFMVLSRSILHEDRYTFMILSRSILLRFRNVADKCYRKIKTHFMFNNVLQKSSLLWDMWKNNVEPGGAQICGKII